LAQKYELLQSNSRLRGCERVMETRAEFHFGNPGRVSEFQLLHTGPDLADARP